MCPKNAKLTRAHGLPKIHKDFVHLPKFGKIIDTTSSTHCHVGQYLSDSFQRLTSIPHNDSFDAINRIKKLHKNFLMNFIGRSM